MDLVAMTYTHIFLGILLVALMRLAGAQGPCPTSCHCTLEILNCSRISNLPGFHQVPLPNPAAPPHPFIYLDFTGNMISSIGKEVWNAYPWTEHLVLKENSLTRLQNTSLEGLLSLTYLDLSYNAIQIIEKSVFEVVPFLQIINLRGNFIQQIAYETFQAWHGMQFLLRVDLSHNPLEVIQDSYFYRLPSLTFLDLGATDITPRTLENILKASLQLRTLILPPKLSCCLCHFKKDINILRETIKLECIGLCALSASLCDKEEPLIRTQEKVMKVLEIRYMQSGSLLHILPERAVPNNNAPEPVEPNNDMLALTKHYSSLVANLKLLESIKGLLQVKTRESIDVNWADQDELKKLCLLATLLEEVLKERIAQLEGDRLEAALQDQLSVQAAKKSTDEAAKQSIEASTRKKRHVGKVRRENWFGPNERQEDTLIRLGVGRQGVAEATRQSAKEPRVSELPSKARSQRELAEGLNPQHDLPFLRPHQATLQSSWKRSVTDSLTNDAKPTGSIIGANNDNGRNPVAVLEQKILTEEELLHQLLHGKSPPAEDAKSKISATDPEPSLNELSPDITLSHETYWEHQSTSPPLNLDLQDDYLLQGDLFEEELNKKLTSLIPNAPVRKLMSHVIRILKMDCTVPTIQMACTKLISRTGLLMKLFSENVNETSSLWKSYFWPSRNAANMSTANSRKLEKPLGKANPEIPEYGYGNKLLLAVSVTAITMIIIAAICLVKICSQRSAAKDQSFLDNRKKSSPDLEGSRTDSQVTEKPLWLKDMYKAQDEMQKNNMDKSRDEASVEEVDIVSWGDARPSLPEPPPKKSSSKALSIPTPPPAPSTAKKGADKGGGTTSSKATSSAAGDEKSEAPTTEATTESPESGEEEDEDED